MKVINDLRLRSSLAVEKEFFDQLTLMGEIELGLEQDVSKLGKFCGELGLEYAAFKFLDVTVSYRYTKNRKNYSEEYKYTNMFAASIDVKQKLDRFKLYYRMKYQSLDEDQNWQESTSSSKNLLKNRLKLKYNIKGSKISPYVSTELYLVKGVIGIDATKLKSIVGFEYNLKKWGDLKMYYRIDQELTQYIPYRFHTLGVSYCYKF
ncbi:MAG: DUF2490 domain-containing protein [Prolixibacteraceae bacterium]|nr:DUF2490 domain-containing protein [Prolixibacteraceae bacterium]